MNLIHINATRAKVERIGHRLTTVDNRDGHRIGLPHGVLLVRSSPRSRKAHQAELIVQKGVTIRDYDHSAATGEGFTARAAARKIEKVYVRKSGGNNRSKYTP